MIFAGSLRWESSQWSLLSGVFSFACRLLFSAHGRGGVGRRWGPYGYRGHLFSFLFFFVGAITDPSGCGRKLSTSRGPLELTFGLSYVVLRAGSFLIGLKDVGATF